MTRTKTIPFYRQMIDLLRKAVALLDEQGKDELLQFILDSQNEDGGFRDRGEKSDLYYSLFGLLILKAMENGERRTNEGSAFILKNDSDSVAHSIFKLKHYVDNQQSAKVQGFIERCCLVMLQKDLKSKGSSWFQSLLSLGRSFWKERTSINLSYRSFVLFLTLDAVLPISSIMKRPALGMMKKTNINEYSPCSEVAAKVFLQKMMNHSNAKDIELLNSFACPSGGFKAFLHVDQADMLSTAVTLFALNYAGADLRLLKPSILHFIQSNYSQGAFLSGDGDISKDVEYTFYGLLALGVLSN